MDEWNYNKRVRELVQGIKNCEFHANREIKNNKVCAVKKIRNSAQRYLEVLKLRYKQFVGEDYDSI